MGRTEPWALNYMAIGNEVQPINAAGLLLD
jgi:alpha-L-arabinofuranosidase